MALLHTDRDRLNPTYAERLTNDLFLAAKLSDEIFNALKIPTEISTCLALLFSTWEQCKKTLRRDRLCQCQIDVPSFQGGNRLGHCCFDLRVRDGHLLADIAAQRENTKRFLQILYRMVRY